MRDRHEGDDALWAQRTPHYQRERLTDLYLKYHAVVADAPKLNKATRRFECGDKSCGVGYKTVDELERHYAAQHASA